MTAVPPPGDDDQWAPGFELPIPSAEGEDKKNEGTSGSKDNDKPVPTKKAETIRGTATVNQPGPNLAERPEQETTAEYFASWDEAERMMRADLEKGKFTPEQVDEVKKLMEAGAIKMKLPYKKAPGEMTIAQWQEKAAKLEAELKNKGQEGDKYVAQLMALQDQLRRQEVAQLEIETRNAKLDKERREAMAKIDKAAQEKRDKKHQKDKEKEEETRKAEAENHAKAMRDKDDKIRALEQKFDALSKQAEVEKKEREKAAAKDTDKDKKVEILQKQALEKNEKIKKLEKDLEEAENHGDDELKATIKRLEHEKKQLKKEVAKMEEVKKGLDEKIRGLESSQVRFLDAAINEEQAGKEREALEDNVLALKKRIQQYVDEEKEQIVREQFLKKDRNTLGAQVVQQQTVINQLNEKVKQSKERITACESTIETLSKALNDSSGKLGREFVVLEAEIEKLEKRVKEQDVKISQQESEIGAQKLKIGEQETKIRIGTPGASHGELAQQNQTILKENMELKKQLDDMQKNLGVENSGELRRQLEASQRQLEASQKEYGVVQECVEKLLQELEEVRKTKFGEGANASEIERLKQELDKATKDIENLTQNTRKAVNEINRLKKENTGGAEIIQTITGKLSRATSEINRLGEKRKEDAEMIRLLKEENEALQFEIGRLRSLRPKKVQPNPSQKELEHNKNRVAEYERQQYEWGAQEEKLKAQVDDYQQQIDELTAITQESNALINTMTAEQKELHETLDKLTLHLAAATAKPIDNTEGGGKAPAVAAERERAHAEKIKELEEQNSALSKQVDALKQEIEKIRKSLTETNTDAEKEKNQLSQQQAHASAQTIHILMGFMILQRALNGKVTGDMNRVLAAVDQARLQAEAVSDEKLIVELSYLAAIAVYYDGDTPKALETLNVVKDSKDWDDTKKDLVKQWIAHCEKGTNCPKGRSGYREALGLGPAPPTYRAPLKVPKDNDGEEANKARKEAKKAKKEAKKAQKAEKKAAKEPKTGTKPRGASEPRRRGIHRPDLYVGILSPRQQDIWDTIDFSDFDYNHLTPEQQSLFSFSPIDSEPESPRRPIVPRRPVVHRGAGPSSELSPLPAPRAHFELPPRPPSDSESDPEAPPPPPPPAPLRPPGKIKPQRPASSGAFSAASLKAAQGVQEGQPSRMSRPTTDAALHIQYLVAQLAESGRRIKELEPAGATVQSLTDRVKRRDKQIENLKIWAEQIVAENKTLKGDAQ
ncbi:uncharacterized protein EAF01_004230 [Botrytis porri]|uniref:uncharacterized protein n=1 Tax=Botrytis porri TaxID=87229 RepID=UPI0018FF5694|nr:uncharacterized protein EAF01_004230 [Botrytis porri]KAF7908475.1 hypothetical protein EAF01_004230 [Botrytis porri]